MKLVKFGFPELSTGGKKSSQVCDLENRGFGQKILKNIRKSGFVLFCGGQNSAGVHNKRLGPFCGMRPLAACRQQAVQRMTSRDAKIVNIPVGLVPSGRAVGELAAGNGRKPVGRQ